MSDHNVMFSSFSIQFELKPKHMRREFFNLKDKSGQQVFLRETTFTKALSSSFSANRTFGHNANIFYKNLNGCIRKCFKKIRIVSGGKEFLKDGEGPIMGHIRLRKELKIFIKNCSCPTGRKLAENTLEEVEKFLDDECSTKNAETVREYVKEVQN